MELPFRLPFCAADISGENDSHMHYADDPALLTERLTRAADAGAGALIAPGDCLIHTDLEEIGRDDDFALLGEGLIRAAKKASAGVLPVGASVLPNELSDGDAAAPAFEDEHLAYLEKMTIFKNAGADFAHIKDHTTLGNMRAAVLAAKQMKLPVIVTVTVDDEGKTSTGTDYIAALITLQSLGADAFGIRCSDGTQALAELIHRAFPHAEIPLAAVLDISSCSDQLLRALCFGGASVFIDTSGQLLAEQTARISRYGSQFDPAAEKDSYAAAVYCEAFFLPEDDIELSEPLDCSYDISDELIDLDDENINSVCVALRSTDEAAVLAESAYMSRLPVTVLANDATTLEAALRYFQGRLIVDSRCDIPRAELEALTERYGAILY